MPAGFEWVTIDVMDPAQIAVVYKLLNENYVEDDDNMFRYARTSSRGLGNYRSILTTYTEIYAACLLDSTILWPSCSGL
jgi:hypothetical protein